MKPDYGLMLAQSGNRDVKQYFYGVPLSHLSVSGPGLYTTILNRQHGGVEYAVSFDFGIKEAAAVLAKAPTSERSRLESKLGAAHPGETVEFGAPIAVDLETRLGEVQSGAGEQFVPLVVLSVGKVENYSAKAAVSGDQPSKSNGCLSLIVIFTGLASIGKAFHWWLT